MKHRVLAGTLSFLFVAQFAYSQSGATTGSHRSAGPSSAGSSRALDPNWTLGNPVSFKNLTVFPVMSRQGRAIGPLITLDEGIRSGRVRIMERGTNGQLRRLRPGRDYEDQAEVNELVVTNRTGKTLVLIAGEIVYGGKQDRILANDCLIASTGRPVPIEVFCVEKHRWESQPFGHSRSIAANRRTGQAESVVVANIPSGTFVSSEQIASLNVREKAVTTKDQSAVWSEVDKTNASNGLAPRTGRLGAVFLDDGVKRNFQEYERAFKGVASGVGVVGAVIAIAGEIRSADVFASNALFSKYWPKLLRSSALEAMNAGQAEQVVDRDAARAFLARVAGERAAVGKKPSYSLVEHRSESVASYELVGTNPGAAGLIHFNKFSRKD
ncbi:MAG TPA: DUF6569 family protein [Blastocatellia bacterium]|nr:DUF6569 family protein [Blastocatellia bacterium]